MVHHEVVSQLAHRLRVMRMYRTGLRVRMHLHERSNQSIGIKQEFAGAPQLEHEQAPLVPSGSSAASRVRGEQSFGKIHEAQSYGRHRGC